MEMHGVRLAPAILKMDDEAIANGCPKCRPRHETVVNPSGKLHPFCHFDLFILGHNQIFPLQCPIRSPGGLPVVKGRQKLHRIHLRAAHRRNRSRREDGPVEPIGITSLPTTVVLPIGYLPSSFSVRHSMQACARPAERDRPVAPATVRAPPCRNILREKARPLRILPRSLHLVPH